MRSALFVCLSLLLCVQSALAQDSLSLVSGVGSPGFTVDLNLSLNLTSPPVGGYAALQWTLTYPAASVVNVTASSIIPSKMPVCAFGPTSTTCVYSGLNNDAVQGGAIAVVAVTLSASASGTVPVGVTSALAASPGGSPTVLGGTGGTITVVPNPVVITQLSCVPAGAASTCTVTLSSGAPTIGAVVALSVNSSSVSVPSSVTVAGGATTANFTVTASPSNGPLPMVAATYNGSSQTAVIYATGAGGLGSLICAPSTVGVNGTTVCTLALPNAAPAGGLAVSLSSDNGVLSVPTGFTIPAGATFGTFAATAGSGSSDQLVTIKATAGLSSTSAIVIYQVTSLQSFDCVPATLGSGGTSTCTITVSRPVLLSGGLPVSLYSGSAALTVPLSVTLPYHATTASFTVSTGSVANSQQVTLTVVMGSGSVSTGISLVATPVVNSLSCLPSSLNSSASSTCTLTLSGAAPAAGVSVSLSTDNSGLSVPSSIVVAGGASATSFAVSTGTITSDQTALVTATLGGFSQSSSLSLAPSQSLTGQVLKGSYFFRQVSLATDSQGNLADARSLLGRMTFDGAGAYSYTALMVRGSGPASSQSGTGSYSVDPAGGISLESPARSGDQVNARYSVEALLGSSTESGSNSFDLFVAIPAPTTTTSNRSLNGSYWAASLEFPGGTFNAVRDSLFLLSASGDGSFQPMTVTGHAADQVGSPLTQQVTGASYSMSSDGSGDAVFGTGSALLGGSKILYVSQDGNVVLGGSMADGSHDILIGIKAGSATPAGLSSGTFWAAGLRRDANTITGFVGSVSSDTSGNLHWTRRLKSLGPVNTDLTQVDSYAVNPDGSGTSGSARLALGLTGFVESAFGDNASNPYEIYFGVPLPVAGPSSLVLDPDGVQNAANLAPAGNPIAPGELIYLHVSAPNLALQTSAAPFPLALGGVTVLINGHPAPLCLVSSTLIEAVVPRGITGPTAVIQVQINGVGSNTTVLPVAATAPGVFSQAGSGSGLGTILHADSSPVTPDQPAHGGEIVSIFLTGLGAVTPPLADGTGSDPSAPSSSVVVPTVLIGGTSATVVFSGMSSIPGLYQINVQLPVIPVGVTTLPVAISTANAYNNQVQIAVQP